MKIALSTDHAGFKQLYDLKDFLEAHGHETVMFGPKALNEDDDYPDFIFPAAFSVAKNECEVGIVFGGSGQGEAMAANRVKGVRCTVFYGPIAPLAEIDANGGTSQDPYEILKLSRKHNHANMLSLAGRFLSKEQIQHAVLTWLYAPFSDEERHKRRVDKLDTMATPKDN
ncbi:MAG: RpiB/LacA/LacB family sugar-phosphate isomerase [Candidatus Saccharimonadales bacterium]